MYEYYCKSRNDRYFNNHSYSIEIDDVYLNRWLSVVRHMIITT